MAGSITWVTENIKALKGSALGAHRRPIVSSAPPVAEGERQRDGLHRRFEFRCGGCGVVKSFPDRCPMCGGTGWETVEAPGSLPPSWAGER